MRKCVLTLYNCPEWGSEGIEVATETRSDLSPLVFVEATRYGDQNRTQLYFHNDDGVVGTVDLMGHLESVVVDYENLSDDLVLAGVGYDEACAMIDAAIEWVAMASSRLELGADA